MAAMRGERFNIPLDDDDDQPDPGDEPSFKSPHVRDIVERTPARSNPPSAPSMTVPQSSTGWPVVESRYRPSPATLRQTEQSPPSMDDFQMREIDAENKRHIAEMSLDDIEEQRSQIFATLNPSLIEKLLKRSADGYRPPPLKKTGTFPDDEPISKLSRHSSQRSVSFALPSSEMDSPHSAESHSLHRSDSDASTASSLLRKLTKEDRRVSFADSDSGAEDRSTAARHSLPGTPQIPPRHLDQPPSPRRLSPSGRKVSFSLPDADGNVEPSATRHGLPTASGSEGGDGLPPSRIQPLGRRVSFAEAADELDEPVPRTTAARHSLPPTPPMPATKPAGSSPSRRSTMEHRVSFAEPEPSLKRRDTASSHSLPIPGAPPAGVHFPKPPMPALDPNSPAFLDDLHATFFPNLAHDPSKLDWMRPRSAAGSSASSGTTPDTARFGFDGALLSPDAAVPETQGLHHHGDAPDAPGYTLAELARLARSALAAQRCVALQTLGRVLYRLGRGDFSAPRSPEAAGGGGGGGGRRGSSGALWARVREERIADTLLEEARRERGHRTAIALAREAVWNWRRGVEEGGGEDGLAGMPELPELRQREEEVEGGAS